MKHPEYQYLELLRKTLEEGEEQVDSGTGVKTYSVFGAQIRFDLSEGFPMLTTKKVYWNGVIQELYWFMSGQSNIKYFFDKLLLSKQVFAFEFFIVEFVNSVWIIIPDMHIIIDKIFYIALS